mmetsp:Transcript_8800/g.24821  ORF Transcript_8800/g.24821 Transcript_8800/m.24821 type:complete len:535 (+) Transcript_8800:862-2466(+)
MVTPSSAASGFLEAALSPRGQHLASQLNHEVVLLVAVPVVVGILVVILQTSHDEIDKVGLAVAHVLVQNLVLDGHHTPAVDTDASLGGNLQPPKGRQDRVEGIGSGMQLGGVAIEADEYGIVARVGERYLALGGVPNGGQIHPPRTDPDRGRRRPGHIAQFHHGIAQIVRLDDGPGHDGAGSEGNGQPTGSGALLVVVVIVVVIADCQTGYGAGRHNAPPGGPVGLLEQFNAEYGVVQIVRQAELGPVEGIGAEDVQTFQYGREVDAEFSSLDDLGVGSATTAAAVPILRLVVVVVHLHHLLADVVITEQPALHIDAGLALPGRAMNVEGETSRPGEHRGVLGPAAAPSPASAAPTSARNAGVVDRRQGQVGAGTAPSSLRQGAVGGRVRVGRSSRRHVAEAGQQGRDGAGRFAPAREEEAIVVVVFVIFVVVFVVSAILGLRVVPIGSAIAIAIAAVGRQGRAGCRCRRRVGTDGLRVAPVIAGRGDAAAAATADTVLLHQLLLVVGGGGLRRRGRRCWNFGPCWHCCCDLLI